MAYDVIICTLGPEWWKNNCTTAARKPDEFLAVRSDCEDDRYDYQDRIIKLGHMLYGLKGCTGFEAFISSLKRRELAPTFFELSVANMLYEKNFAVEFVEAKGQKGSDYDLLVERNGTYINVEAKSRRGGIILGENTLHNTLAKARKQLPSSGPSIIFVSIPQEWTMVNGAERVIVNCVKAFFRNSARVNYVVWTWNQWIELETGRASASIVRQFKNLKARTPLGLDEIIQTLKMPISINPDQTNFTPSFW
jgi:hypothetical protein